MNFGLNFCGPQKMAQKRIQKVSKKVSQKVSKKVSRKVTKKVSKKVSKKMTKKVSKKVSKKMSKKVSKKCPKNVKKKWVQKLSKIRHWSGWGMAPFEPALRFPSGLGLGGQRKRRKLTPLKKVPCDDPPARNIFS